MHTLTVSEVESAVRRVWGLFAAKKIDQWQSFYADVASVFGTGSKRPEPARLAVLRRQREYLTNATRLAVHVGKVDVEIIGPDCAVAAYTMQFDAEQIARLSAAGQKDHQEHLENARVTHVFQRDSDGKLRIVHEHISATAI